MKILSRKISLLLIISMVFSAMIILPSEAASGTMRVSVSSQTVSVGQTFTVTVNYSGDVQIANAEWCLNYDANLASYEEMNGKIRSRYDSSSLGESEKSFSQVYTFKALAVGTINFSISDYLAYPILPEDGDYVSISADTASIKIVSTGSSNANLSTLKVSAGTLTPAFSNDITSYTVNVPYSVSSLSISAVASEDGRANVSVSGTDELKVGENKRTVIVTAEDGTVKKFEITIVRAQSVQTTPSPAPTDQASAPTAAPQPTEPPAETENVLEVTVNGAILTISEKPESITLPDNFEETTYNYKGEDVWAAKCETNNLLLLYMVDDGNEKSGFYVYDEGNDSFYRFVSIYLENDTYSILQPSVSAIVPTGFYEKTARINGADLTVWVPEADRYYDVEDCRYLLVYAMRKDGSTGFYLYDTVETAFLKYSDSLFNLSGSVGVTPVPDVTPVPNDTDLNDPESETELSLWGECKAYFGRLFGSEATAVDWLITVFLILFIVLLMVLAVFIVYAVKKRKEEAEDSVPLSVPGETRNFRKMVSLEEYEEEEPGESENTSDTEADEAVEDVIEEEPASHDIEEAEEEKTAEQPLDFTIADLEGESMDFEEAEEDRTPDTDEKPEEWPLDEKVFDDFIDKDDKKE